MIDNVTQQQASWQPVPLKFEAGTPNISGAIALGGAAIDYLNHIGMDQIAAKEQRLTTACLQQMKKIPGIKIYGPLDPNHHTGVIAFNIQGIYPHDVSTGLDLEGIEVRAGHHCAQPLMDYLGIESTVRASFYFYNTMEDVEQFIQALIAVKEFFDHESH